MKKKLKAMKRRWRKLLRTDRQFFRLTGAFLVLYLMLLPLSITFLGNIIWMIGLITLHYIHIGIRRNRQYVYWQRGRMKQLALDWEKARKMRYENAELRFKNDRLNSDYKKLEYDYNQLKKSVNPIKKKKK